MQTPAIFPQYAVYAGYAFTAYLSETDQCKVCDPSHKFSDIVNASIEWNHNSYLPWLDNQPKLVATADNPGYVQVLCTEAEFRAAYQAAKVALEANESQWLTPAAMQYATTAQKTEIVRLLNNPFIDRIVCTATLLRINRLTPETAEVKLTELRAYIDQRENGQFEVVGEVFTVKAA